MTPRENFLAMLNGEGPEWVPLYLDLTPPVEDELEKRRGTRDVIKGLGSEAFIIDQDFEFDPQEWEEAYREIGVVLPPRSEIGLFGITNTFPESRGKAYHLCQQVHTLADIEDVALVEKLPWPDLSDSSHYQDAEARVAEAKDKGLPAVLNTQCSIFEFSWYLRGMDNLFADLMGNEGISDWLLDFMTLRSMMSAGAYARAGVDVIWLGDDIGMQTGMLMAPDFWRKHLKPRLAKVIEAIRANETGRTFVMYHSDGNIEAVIDELLEIGVDILNPVQPECMDVAKIVSRYGDRCAFWGMIGTQSVLPHGTPDEVRQKVRQICEFASRGTRVICSPTHVIEPDVPWENLMALVETPRTLS